MAFPEHEAMSRQQRQSLIRSANHQIRGQAAKADARVRVEQSGVLRRIKVHVNVHGGWKQSAQASVEANADAASHAFNMERVRRSRGTSKGTVPCRLPQS